MKIKPISIGFYGIGVIGIIISILQWIVWFSDFSQFIFGATISFLYILFGFLYGILRDIQDEQEALGRTTSEIINKVEIK